MAELLEKIKDYFIHEGQGVKAKVIAEKLGVPRQTVNSMLYAHLDIFVKDVNYQWWYPAAGGTIRTEQVQEMMHIDDPVLNKLQNKENARYYTIVDFNALADWTRGSAFSPDPRIYVTNTGNVIECDSDPEVKMLGYLEDNDLVQAIGGQNLIIKYSSAFRNNLNYHPDIVTLTNEGHIAIIEVKSIAAMDCHKNLEKYEALELYCEENGFEYMMIDPDYGFMTLGELMGLPGIRGLDEEMADLNVQAIESDEPVFLFDDETVEKWFEKYGTGMIKKEFKLYVHSNVIFYDWYNLFSNSFKVYSDPVMYVDD